MFDFTYIDETLDLNLTQSYYLSIQVNLNGLSFCIYSPVQNKYIALVHKNIKQLEFNDYLNFIEKEISENEFLQNSFKSVRLIWVSNKNILIPEHLFSKENIKSHFEFVQKIDEYDELHYRNINIINTVSIFTIPYQVANIFANEFKNIKFYNQQDPFLNHIYNKYTGLGKLFVNVNKEFIDVAVIENGSLLLYNNFLYKSEMDIVYFVMNVYNKYQNDSGLTDVVLSGFIDKKSDSYLKLKEFIPHIKFEKLSEDFSYSYTFKKIPNHSFINLFNLIACE